MGLVRDRRFEGGKSRLRRWSKKERYRERKSRMMQWSEERESERAT